jgi:hypothetical protein
VDRGEVHAFRKFAGCWWRAAAAALLGFQIESQQDELDMTDAFFSTAPLMSAILLLRTAIAWLHFDSLRQGLLRRWFELDMDALNIKRILKSRKPTESCRYLLHCYTDEPQQDLPSDDGVERELDMDALNNATLWKLKAYVDGVLTATTGAQ